MRSERGFCGGRDLSLPPQLGVEERDRWGLLLIWCLLFVYRECSLFALQSLQTGRKAATLDHGGSRVSQAVRGGSEGRSQFLATCGGRRVDGTEHLQNEGRSRNYRPHLE